MSATADVEWQGAIHYSVNTKEESMTLKTSEGARRLLDRDFSTGESEPDVVEVALRDHSSGARLFR
ncbi:MAG: hypothetical protein ACE5KM_12660 [Planctomycetaceae bacterium]